MSDFSEEMGCVINKHSMEKGSNTPDYILAVFLEQAMWAFDNAVKDRTTWYGSGEYEATKLPDSSKPVGAIAEHGDSFHQFARNGVWGICAACPRSADGMVYPEDCERFNREDHRLGLHILVEQWDRTVREGESE